MMKPSKAVKLAIWAMKQVRQKYAFDANLGERLRLDNPANRNAAKIRKDLAEAIDVLEKLSVDICSIK